MRPQPAHLTHATHPGDLARRRRGPRLRAPGVVALVLVAALVLVGAGCSSGGHPAPARPAATPGPPVVLFGDSLSWEARSYWTALVAASGASPVTYTARGSAICDWTDEMRKVAQTLRPRAVEIQFSGNALTPCMKPDASPTAVYLAKYAADTRTAVGLFLAVGAHVWLIGAPVSRSEEATDPGWDRLNQQYQAIAASYGSRVTYSDAGAAVEAAGHRFTQTLPCLADEPCGGPVVDGIGTNIVRAPDGAHFCPVEKDAAIGSIGPCPMYSSGAYRFAFAMVSAMTAGA